MNTLVTTLRQLTSTSTELWLNGRILSYPIGEGIFAILNDAVKSSVMKVMRICKASLNVRFASLISIICISRFTRSDGSVVNKLQQVFTESSNDGKLLAVLLQGIELVSESSLEFLASNVGELSFSHEGLGLSTDKFLLQNDNLWRVGLLVFQLSNLVSNLLLACMRQIC